MSITRSLDPLEPGATGRCLSTATELLEAFDRVHPGRLRMHSHLGARSQFSTTVFWSRTTPRAGERLDSLMGSYQIASLLLPSSAWVRAERWLRALTLLRFVESSGFDFVPLAAECAIDRATGRAVRGTGQAAEQAAAFYVRLLDFYWPLVGSSRAATAMSELVPMSCTVVPMPVRAAFPMSEWKDAPVDVERIFGYAFMKRRSIPRLLLQGPGLFDAALQWYRLSLRRNVLRVEMFFLASPRFQGLVDVGGRDPLFDWIARYAPRAWHRAFREHVDRAMVGHHCAVHDCVVSEILEHRLGGSELGGAERRARPARGWAGGGATGVARSPGTSRVATRELGNKLRIYRLVDANRVILRRTSDPQPAQLAPLVRRALALGSFEALWAIEGLGRDHTHDELSHGSPGRRMLRDEDFDVVPACGRLMLHAGLGLAVAERVLARLEATTTKTVARREVGSFVHQCRRHSLHDHVYAAFESLGLVTRVFHRRLVPLVTEAVHAVAPEVEGAFWHGLGRALYFTPRSFVPMSAGRSIRSAAAEGGHGAPRHNAMAGIAWALTLANQRDPEVLARLVVGPLGHRLLSEPGFGHGVASAVRVREQTTPNTSFARAFADYCPSDPSVCEPALWDAVIGEPARRALQWSQRSQRSDRKVRSLFEYDPHDG